MAKVLAEFAEHIASDEGVVYRAQASGAQMPDGRWEGWVEFIPVAGGTPVRTPRETTQPNHRDAVYWASGITGVYLEGALSRALKPRVHVPVSSPKPVFDEPAPDTIRPADVPVATRAVDVPVADAVLDPFEVHAYGEPFLRAKLSALAPRHLVDIIVAYDLSDKPVSSLEELSPLSLIELIIYAVRVRSRR